MNFSLTASFPFSFQYSLLQTVVEACQKKRHCKFLASPKTFGGDPCPGHRKFVEVAYKCRPCKYCQGCGFIYFRMYANLDLAWLVALTIENRNDITRTLKINCVEVSCC